MVWYGLVWFGLVWYGMVCIYIYISCWSVTSAEPQGLADSQRTAQGRWALWYIIGSRLQYYIISISMQYYRYYSWLVVWNMFYFPIQLGVSSSQLTNVFQRGGSTTTRTTNQNHYEPMIFIHWIVG